MNIQTSFTDQDHGKLYIVPTPIGNLKDITYRAIEVLQTVSLIAAEDTRHTRKLLNYYEINTPLISYHEHNEKQRSEELLSRLKKGDSIGLVSDAGMPGISDPGYILIQKAIEENFDVIALPGANAALTALVGSGLAMDHFLFYGFLPRKQREKRAILETLQDEQATLIFYESPYRVKDTVTAIDEQFGQRQLVIARELTKQFETYIRGKTKEIIAWLETEEIIGECCIIVSGNQSVDDREDKLWWAPLSVIEHVEHYIHENELTAKEAIKKVAEERHMKRRDVYQIYHRQ